MRFAYAGIDFMADAFDALVAAGWEPVKLFTRPCDGVLDHNERIVAAARARRIPIQMSRLTADDAADLERLGCGCLVVAGYPWRVLGWSGRVPYAFNIHPSPLPEGRGPYPLYRAILDERAEWGVAAHVLDPEFDTGAVLARERFALSPQERHETLLAKCQMATRRLCAGLAADLPGAWSRAEPQGPGSYWPRATDAQRTLEWTLPVRELTKRVRAFGMVETLARIGASTIHVADAHGWEEAHAFAPGTVAHSHRRILVIAVADGFLALTRWSPVSLYDARGFGR